LGTQLGSQYCAFAHDVIELRRKLIDEAQFDQNTLFIYKYKVIKIKNKNKININKNKNKIKIK